jgi:16S rRNA (adenine1518-N6/adenine1519-N6)-dimethyltransferase
MIQTLSEIRASLAARGIRPKHRYGQNFLHDGNQMARIVAAARIVPDELVLEVGAGTGGLTERLLDAGARVVAVEIDRRLEPILQERLGDRGDRVRLVIADVLASKHQINPQVIEAIQQAGRCQARTSDGSPRSPVEFKLIANLPYNVGSPLLANLAIEDRVIRMTLAVVLLQREVAQRLTAPPGTKQYGPLGVLIQAMYEVQCIGTVSPSCFWPRPQVESAIVRLRRRAVPATDDPTALAETLQRLFSTRRKQVGTILGRDHHLPQGIDPSVRPEDLTVEQIVTLSRSWRPR